jgi:ribosome-interacting GTPase 1
MPANLSQPYLEAEQRYRAATTTEEKAAALEEMIALLPKHKGTEKIFADLKTKLAKLRKAGDKKAATARHTGDWQIEREGAGQVVLLGGPNTGKSALMAALTNAPVEVTEYPFSTRRAIPGAMRFEDVRVQLVDTPSLSPDFVDPFLIQLVRTADAAVLCVDLSSPECLEQPDWVLGPLSAARITLVRGTVAALAKAVGPKSLPAILAATKLDHPDAETALELVRESIGDRFPIVVVSVERADTLDAFRRACFDLFGLVRVYSKAPGKEPERSAPFLLPVGATVLDFASKVHKDFTARLSYARVWGEGKYDGQRVAREHPVQDRDVIELHLG